MVGGVCVWEGCGGAWDTCCPLGQGRSHHGAISGECDTRGASRHGSVLVAGGRCCWGTWWGPGWWLGHLGRPGDGSLVPGCEAGLVGENVRESLKKLGPGARPWSHVAACGWEGLVLRGAVGQAPGLCSGTLHVALCSTGTWPHRHLMVSSSTGWQLPRGGQQGRGLQPGPVPYPAGEQARLGTALDIRQLPGNSLPQSSFILGAVCAVSQRYESVSPLPCLLPDVVCILIA